MLGAVGATTLLPPNAIAQPTAIELRPSPTNRAALKDVQLGEADNLLRIAFVCSSDCTIERSVNQSYFLRGVTADIELDVSRRSRHLNRLALSVDGDDSRISFDVSSEFESPIARPCALEGVDAVCLDFKRGDAAFAAADLTDQDDDAPEDDNQTALAQPAAPSDDSDASVIADLSPDDTSEPTLAQQGVAPPTQASLEADLPLRQSAAPGFGYDYDFRFDFYPARPRPMDPPPLLIRARQIDQPALQPQATALHRPATEPRVEALADQSALPE
ncbi:MAG: hypothetical protein AAGA22_01075 [Pseudomonadota bacterium]